MRLSAPFPLYSIHPLRGVLRHSVHTIVNINRDFIYSFNIKYWICLYFICFHLRGGTGGGGMFWRIYYLELIPEREVKEDNIGKKGGGGGGGQEYCALEKCGQ
jgi:hypothetical protein